VTPLNRPFAIEVAIRDAENDILVRVSDRLESELELLSPVTAAAIVRKLMHI
jgi:hypothetical protein